MDITRKTVWKSRRWDDPTLDLAMREFLGMVAKNPGGGAAADAGFEIEFRVEPGRGGYAVAVAKERLTFSAPSPVEILYAVCTFAEEHLGFCFFEPGHDRIRPLDVVRLPEGPLGPERRPLLRHRGLVQEYPFSDRNYVLADWMAKNRLNYLLTWMKHYDGVPPAMKEFYRVRGITIESGHHSFEYWIPTDRYYAAHPEYFAIQGGRRVTPARTKEGFLLGVQLCATNPDVRRVMAENMAAYAAAHPELRSISIIPNDGFGWCECESCTRFYDKTRRGELYCLSEHVYRAERLHHDMVTDVARHLRALRPDLELTFAAYVNYVDPAEGFRLTPGLAVYFAPYWRCINHRLDDPACPINSRYLQAFERWRQAKAGGSLRVYEYYMGVQLYLSLPMIHHEDVFPEIRTLAERGAEGLLTQFWLDHWVAYGANFYLMAKAAWGEDAAAATARWLEAVFGPEAGEARAFYAELKALQHSAGLCHIPYPRSLLRRTEVERYRRVHGLALALLAKRPDDRFRQGLVLWTEFMVRFKEAFDRYQSGQDVCREVAALLDWIRANAGNGVFVTRNCETLLNRWIERMEQGLPWYHYGLDWEDEYIRRHDTLLNQKW